MLFWFSTWLSCVGDFPQYNEEGAFHSMSGLEERGSYRCFRSRHHSVADEMRCDEVVLLLLSNLVPHLVSFNITVLDFKIIIFYSLQ